MNAKELYAKLDKDFEINNLTDNWSFMKFNEYIAPGFIQRHMGTVLDNSVYIKKVYTAAMPDTNILEKIIKTNETDILLFSHHAMGYDPTLEGFPFYNIPDDYFELFKERRISFYMLHSPLDKNGTFSTSVSLANNLGLEIIDEFCEYEGIKCGVVCRTDIKSAEKLAELVKKVVGHKVKLTLNGNDTIDNGRVGVAAGGGSVDFAARELSELGINIYITGCTREVPAVKPIAEFHRIMRENNINLIGATHYSTEKFACMAMVNYFTKTGLQAEFLEGRYFLEDL